MRQSIAGWSSSVARRAHNPKVVGSNPAPATIILIKIRHLKTSDFFMPIIFICRTDRRDLLPLLSLSYLLQNLPKVTIKHILYKNNLCLYSLKLLLSQYCKNMNNRIFIKQYFLCLSDKVKKCNMLNMIQVKLDKLRYYLHVILVDDISKTKYL